MQKKRLSKKYLIVNADDLGYARGINEGIVKAYKEGIVTSTSLMVYGKASGHGVGLVKKNPGLGVGLHFQIEDYDWNLLWQLEKVVAATLIENTKREFLHQIELFRNLTGKMPDHIDGHHHVHRMPRIYQFVRSWCHENNTPMRGQVNFVSKFFGMPSDKVLTSENLIKILRNLPNGTSELMCHPGIVSPDLKSSYSRERELELNILTSHDVKEEIKRSRIGLVSWKILKEQ